MPDYRVIVEYVDGTSVKGIRYHQSSDLLYVYSYFAEQVERKAPKPVESIEIFMVPKSIDDVEHCIPRYFRN